MDPTPIPHARLAVAVSATAVSYMPVFEAVLRDAATLVSLIAGFLAIWQYVRKNK